MVKAYIPDFCATDIPSENSGYSSENIPVSTMWQELGYTE